MTALLLAVAASGAWGVSDFLGGLRARTIALPVVLAGSQLCGLVVLLAALSGRLWSGGLVSLPLAEVGAAALAGASGMVAVGLLYVAMSRGGTVVVAPVSAGTALVAMLAGLVRGERPGPGAAAGAVLAVGGALLIGLAERRPAGRPSGGCGARDAREARDRPLVLATAAGSAVCAGLFLVAIRAASSTDPVTATLVNRVVATALVLAWALGRRPDLATVRRAGLLPLVAVAAVGITDAAAELCFAFASVRAPLSLVTPLASLYPAVAVLLGRVLLGERVRPLALAGVGSAVAGVALLGAGG